MSSRGLLGRAAADHASPGSGWAAPATRCPPGGCWSSAPRTPSAGTPCTSRWTSTRFASQVDVVGHRRPGRRHQPGGRPQRVPAPAGPGPAPRTTCPRSSAAATTSGSCWRTGCRPRALTDHGVGLLTALVAEFDGRYSIAPPVIATQARVALGDHIAQAMGVRTLIVVIGERPGPVGRGQPGHLPDPPAAAGPDRRRPQLHLQHPPARRAQLRAGGAGRRRTGRGRAHARPVRGRAEGHLPRPPGCRKRRGRAGMTDHPFRATHVRWRSGRRRPWCGHRSCRSPMTDDCGPFPRTGTALTRSRQLSRRQRRRRAHRVRGR